MARGPGKALLSAFTSKLGFSVLDALGEFGRDYGVSSNSASTAGG